MTLLQEIFESSAARWPERVAVEIPPGRCRPARLLATYAEVQFTANRFASHLRPLISGECVVGILLPRTTPQLFSAQLAVLQAGGAYTCLDTLFPDERMREILEDAGVQILLTDSAGRARLRSCGWTAGTVLDVGELTAMGAAMPVPEWLKPESLAYVIYTSGTTGRPKGVMIEHRSIVNLVESDVEAFRLAPDARVAQGSSAAYDSSMEEAWLAFAAGGTLVVMDDDAARLGPDLIAWLQEERISVFCPPPTLLRATGCDDPAAALPGLKLLYVGGEALPQDVADRWAPAREMVNGYGPTECTVTCLRDEIEAGQPITIGRPVRGATAWVLDEAGEEKIAGEQGELCVGGVGVARGYWNLPDLTAEKFIDHPRHGWLYRTGDLAHRDAAGRFFYHGRIDAQVKLRGYRIELGEIESRLAAMSGVRVAACCVQTRCGQDVLVAFVVADDALRPPRPGDLKSALESSLQGYMVPGHIGLLDQLPTTVGGKLDRAALPSVDLAPSVDAPVLPRNAMESLLCAAVQQSMGLTRPVSIHEDFFNDLGGDSLRAAQLVSLLRQDPATRWVAVRDIYDARSVAALAGRARSAQVPESIAPSLRTAVPVRPIAVTIAQVVWLVAFFGLMSIAGGWLVFNDVLPALHFSLVPAIVLAPLLAVVAVVLYVPMSLLAALSIKRLLIGRYRSLRVPVWSGFYLRHWMVRQVVGLVPWSLMSGTVLQIVALRMLGARIGQRVHIHRDVDLQQGGWDLLDIGDDVTLSQSAALRLVELDAGDIVIAPVVLGDASTLETRAGVSGGAVLEAGAYLTALSSLPAGSRIPRDECWDGVPARKAGVAPGPPELTAAISSSTPWQQGILLLLARAGLTLLLVLPLEIATIVACGAFDLHTEQVKQWMLHGAAGWKPWMIILGLELLLLPLTLAWMAVLTRGLGQVRAGTISRWSPVYIRVWLKSGLVESAGTWLSGTLFWVVWLRWAGMKVGRGCEISSILNVVPELVEIGPDSFLADGIYLGGARIQQGRVMLGATRLGSNTFLGNHVVVAAGQHCPDDVLFGIATPARNPVHSGSAWFGHPPFELPRREVVQLDRRMTHEPSTLRLCNRIFWEALRFALPILPLVLVVMWLRILAGAQSFMSLFHFMVFAVPLTTLLVTAIPCVAVLGLKWMLLGRVAPGQHPLWSCWCSRWDFLYVAWGQYARRALSRLEGTLLLPWFLRAMGMKIGRRVVLGSGFAQVVDPDMIEIGDGATVNAMFQAHTFEDRVLKLDKVVIQSGATLGCATVPLYGAQVGEGAHVAAHSVIMKGERLSARLRYEGVPTVEVP